MVPNAEHANVDARVRRIVIDLIPESERSPTPILSDTSILELGFDSLRIAELTVALEEGLGIAEFPMQRWADAESCREDARFTLGSLVEACTSLVAARLDKS